MTDAIVQAAREYVKEQLQAAMDDCKSKLPPDISQADLVTAMQNDEAVQEWQQARLRLEGEYGDKTWQYIFVQTKNPNAFVTEILPQRFFITSSMLQIAETSDELAVVLGHEGMTSVVCVWRLSRRYILHILTVLWPRTSLQSRISCLAMCLVPTLWK